MSGTGKSSIYDDDDDDDDDGDGYVRTNIYIVSQSVYYMTLVLYKLHKNKNRNNEQN